MESSTAKNEYHLVDVRNLTYLDIEDITLYTYEGMEVAVDQYPKYYLIELDGFVDEANLTTIAHNWNCTFEFISAEQFRLYKTLGLFQDEEIRPHEKTLY